MFRSILFQSRSLNTLNIFLKDANVYVQLFGKHSSTEKIILESSKTHRNKFERGNTDTFLVRAANVGDLKQLKIGHDNKGIGPGWHLKEVLIECNNKRFLFPCNMWLDKHEDDGKIERDLIVIDSIADESKRHEHRFIGMPVDYEVIVITSDITGAGIDANVKIKIYGDLRKSDIIKLEKSKTHRNKFEKGNTDQFSIREEYFGDILKLKYIFLIIYFL